MHEWMWIDGQIICNYEWKSMNERMNEWSQEIKNEWVN